MLLLLTAQAFAKQDCENVVHGVGEVIAFPKPDRKAKHLQVLTLMNSFDLFALMNPDRLYALSEAGVLETLHGFENGEAYLNDYFAAAGLESLAKDFAGAVERFDSSPALARLRDLGEHYQLVHAWNQFERLEHIFREGRRPPPDEMLPELDNMLVWLSELRKRMESHGEGHASEFLNAFEGWMNRNISVGRYLCDQSEISARLDRMMVIAAHLQINDGNRLRRRRGSR